jgi:hypothetical protein
VGEKEGRVGGEGPLIIKVPPYRRQSWPGSQPITMLQEHSSNGGRYRRGTRPSRPLRSARSESIRGNESSQLSAKWISHPQWRE